MRASFGLPNQLDTQKIEYKIRMTTIYINNEMTLINDFHYLIIKIVNEQIDYR